MTASRSISLVLAALLLLVACDGGGEDSPTATPTASTDAGAPFLDWQRVPDEERATFGGEGMQRMLGVAEENGIIVAVGYDSAEAPDLDAAVWRSQDGTTWSRIRHDEALFGGDADQVMNRVITYGGAFIAAGYDRSDGSLNARIWRSLDGMTWTSVGSVEQLGGDGDQTIEALAVFRDRIYAAGSTGAKDESDAAIWVSNDGTSWTRVESDGFERSGAQRLLDITPSSDALIAVGQTELERDRDGAIWRSTDGHSWHQLDVPAIRGEGSQSLVSVAVGEGAFVAAGDDETTGETVTIWRSEDGVGWSEVDGAKRPFAGHFVQSLNGLNASPFGFIALGCALTDDREDAALWFSPDGLSWAKQLDVSDVFGGDGGQYIEALKLTGGLVIGVGYVSETEDIDAAAWVAPLPPGMPPSGRISISP